jgi:ATP-dependent Clp protease ATP-binding subunit ClpB
VARLIGAPPGYVGYEEGGYLTEAVRRKPYSVLLLDEVEKAHPDVFNILLQVMDDGRLTDGHGRTVDFRNTVIVMTSNLGSDRIQEMMNADNLSGDNYEQVKKVVLDTVVKHFSPEFVNRIDETVVFHPLMKDQIRGIASIQIDLLNRRLAHSELAIKCSDAVLDHIASVGYDPVYGARPLKRAIQNWIENPLAQHVLQGEYGPGDTIAVDIDDEQVLQFSKIAAPAEQAVA